MPGSQREVSNAEEEGVVFNFLAAPEGFTGDAASGGQVTGVTAHRIHLGAPDASGRQSPTLVSNSRFDLPATMVIEALGFDPDNYPMAFNLPNLALTPNGQIKIDAASKMTSIPGIFAAGDNARGASLVVWGNQRWPRCRHGHRSLCASKFGEGKGQTGGMTMPVRIPPQPPALLR